MQNLRILISRPDRIGDVVLSTPLPREIKNKYPNSFVSVLIRNYTKDIYLNNPFVDEIIVLPENGIYLNFQLFNKIKSLKFTHAIMLLPNKNINWLLFFAGIKNRISTSNKIYHLLTGTKIVSRNKYIPLRHEADYCLDTIRYLGIEISSIYPEIYLTEEEILSAKEIKNTVARNGEKLIGINISSGNSAPNLQKEEYAKLIKKMLELKNIKIAITDYEIPDAFKKIDGLIFFNENKPLRKSIVNISALDLLISASTGPMHIAAALKVKTVSLFCPLTACSPKLWGPLGNDSIIILPEADYCNTNCPGDPKLCDFSGPGGIDAEKLFSKIKNLIV